MSDLSAEELGVIVSNGLWGDQVEARQGEEAAAELVRRAAALEVAEKELAEWKISASDQGLPLPSETIQRRLAAAEARVAELETALRNLKATISEMSPTGIRVHVLHEMIDAALAVSSDTSKEKPDA